jgi:uncharacterized protein YbjT (DUF2867 family)
MKIVVVGGTGPIGSKTVSIFQRYGHEVVVASPENGVDTITGTGLKEAMTGAKIVIDLSSAPSFDPKAAMEFLKTASRNLLAAGRAAGVWHHVMLSIIGADQVTGQGYFRAKFAQEKLVAASGIPYTIIRSPQFLEFVGDIADAKTDGGAFRLSPSLLQLIAADDVAAAVVKMALTDPRNGITEIGGPERGTCNEIIAEPSGAHA